MESLSTLIQSIRTFTKTHAHILSAFVLHEYINQPLLYHPHLLPPPCTSISNSSPHMIAPQSGIFPPPRIHHHPISKEEPFRSKMVLHIIDGIGMHAQSDRKKLQQYRAMLFDKEPNDALDKSLSQQYRCTLQSYNNCIATLVDIAEHSIRCLPPDPYPQHTMIGGRLMLAFVNAYIHPSHKENSLNALHPTRYAYSVVYANDSIYSSPKIRWEIHGIQTPSPSVNHIVRSLYLRGLVDVSICNCGFGDWLVWNHLPVTPLDPLLFEHDLNYDDCHDDPHHPWNEYCRDEVSAIV